ncbi:hypothetical protein ALO71_101752 [Pseudomonas amygdali pv. dendropanacis]|uniref:Uncharacterized protein n=4 Tax=Pseudomonas syringae group genomosp. 2 TaxID=251698 RepID=A0A3M5ZPX6_PSESS|nr:hypothetical protein ALO78_101577 [Pseudomonas amygdali pv. ciccaronei]KPX14502.1 hypothetical protein ALO71_101752 [Pseudomonas amygdali pv. dendropanacis]KPX65403.1 hypothetical protein ALO53_101896 [Pseudomonas amygdali pv. photiniae]KPY41752.1 hypothetical protein ALO49_101719 [Pseudomonas savastanoi pv. retacarpa]KPY79431.1 hypothetical protein ALO58_101691 [Pseudomonas savastanoi pv. savastanoi]RMT70282.1 hypothetical protein ALP42_101766 [Pseudomonas savastanoi pv. nerii]RMV08756.1 
MRIGRICHPETPFNILDDGGIVPENQKLCQQQAKSVIPCQRAKNAVIHRLREKTD